MYIHKSLVEEISNETMLSEYIKIKPRQLEYFLKGNDDTFFSFFYIWENKKGHLWLGDSNYIIDKRNIFLMESIGCLIIINVIIL